MHDLKPKEQHERILANADIEKIVQHLENGEEQEVTRIAVTLARQCELFVHFRRLWMLRVSDLGEVLSSEKYMRKIFINKRGLHKELIRTKTL